jgi:rhamnulokinase
MDNEASKKIPAAELYKRTGIQKQIFNTIYQLLFLRLNHPEELERAEHFLMVPEYFNFLLTGVKMNEYTNATTTQLVDVKTRTWDAELLDRFDIPKKLFGKLHMPKTLVGSLKDEIKNVVGFDCEVVLPATHDTGSAVLSVPANDNDFIYLSSGTWSLIGTECTEPNCGKDSFMHNFTNEGGVDYRFRHLKNIMGLWIVQSVKREFGGSYSFDELCNMARDNALFKTIIDVNDTAFLAPQSMISAIGDYCERHGLQKPVTLGELMACVYNSLAASYAKAIEEIEEISGRSYTRLHIVGGGTKDRYLNELTARYSGKAVFTGSTEATAIGNLLAQMLRYKEFKSIEEARESVANSFNIKKVEV